MVQRPQTQKIVVVMKIVGVWEYRVALRLIRFACQLAGASIKEFQPRRRPWPLANLPKMNANEITARKIDTGEEAKGGAR